jgi:SAM-dependent methyltransferase
MSEHMYTDRADWWTLLSPVEDYAEEAAVFRSALLEHAPTRPRTLLELGSGGGNNAFYLKADFEMTLVDVAADMLRQSRNINPELRHYQGDMRDVRLGEQFDAVFIHDAIDYMTTRADLERAMKTAYVHCRSGGIALFVPDSTAERFEPETSSGGTDLGRRGFRYLEWSWDPDPDDEMTTTDYVFAIRDEHGAVRVMHDRHVNGLFPREVWLATLASVGFEPQSRIYEHSTLEAGYEVFIGLKSIRRDLP